VILDLIGATVVTAGTGWLLWRHRPPEDPSSGIPQDKDTT
jgi:hypothetical protein